MDLQSYKTAVVLAIYEYQMVCVIPCQLLFSIRGVVPGGVAHPDFGRSVNPISTRGTDYAHLITTGIPGFSDLPTALHT